MISSFFLQKTTKSVNKSRWASPELVNEVGPSGAACSDAMHSARHPGEPGPMSWWAHANGKIQCRLGQATDSEQSSMVLEDSCNSIPTSRRIQQSCKHIPNQHLRCMLIGVMQPSQRHLSTLGRRFEHGVADMPHCVQTRATAMLLPESCVPFATLIFLGCPYEFSIIRKDMLLESFPFSQGFRRCTSPATHRRTESIRLLSLHWLLSRLMLRQWHMRSDQAQRIVRALVGFSCWDGLSLQLPTTRQSASQHCKQRACDTLRNRPVAAGFFLSTLQASVWEEDP